MWLRLSCCDLTTAAVWISHRVSVTSNVYNYMYILVQTKLLTFLFVSVPPHQLILYDKSGRDVSGVVGPLEESNELVLVCEVRGGKTGSKSTYKYLLTFLNVG